MLKSGKLKLADDMIVTAQEAANKAETVFTIYDDTTNTEIASGPIGGGGGGGGDTTKNRSVKIKLHFIDQNGDTVTDPVEFPVVIKYQTSNVLGEDDDEVSIPGLYFYADKTQTNIVLEDGMYLEQYAPANGGVLLLAGGLNTIKSVSKGAVEVVANKLYYFTTDGEATVQVGR